jgi:hypothetical protein
MAFAADMSPPDLLPTSQIDHFLAFSPSEVKDIVFELRSILSGASASLEETFLWGGLSYHDPSKGGRVKGAVCAIELRKGPVRLSFIHGARLNDPGHFLHGDRLSKRFLEIPSYQEAPWEPIRELIDQAANLDPTTFGPIHRGARTG